MEVILIYFDVFLDTDFESPPCLFYKVKMHPWTVMDKNCFGHVTGYLNTNLIV